MKRKSLLYKKIQSSITVFFLLITSVLSFYSCDNFLDAGETSKEIKEIIEYNNTPSCTVLFRADEGTGSFLTSNEKSLKIGYESQIEFEVNKEKYIFTDFEVVSKSNTTQSLAEFVKITPINYDDQKGLYSANIKLLSKKENILIRPSCIQIPKITEISPKFESTGCDQDKPIVFTFNKNLNQESIKKDAVISIYSDSQELNDYFNIAQPVFSQDGKSMYINTSDFLLLPPDGEKDTMTVYVRYDFSKVLDCENQPVNQSGVYEYRVNKAYGNQVKVKVYAQSNKGINISLNANEYKECSVGFSTDINFTINTSDFYFAGFEAVKYSNPEQSVENEVKIEAVQLNGISGLYKAHISVLSGNEDILIKMKALEIPAVLSHEPDFIGEGVNPGKTIIFNFNVPMEDQTVSAADSIFNYQNISITYNSSSDSEVDISQYFEEPVFNQSKTKLTITPKPMEFNNFIAVTLHQTVLDVNVSLGDNIVVTSDGKTLPLKQDKNTKFSVRYNASLETVKPVKTELFATIDKISLTDNSISRAARMSSLSYDQMSDEEIFANRVKDYIYIYGKYYDKDSGVQKVGLTLDDENTVFFDDNSSDAQFLFEENGDTRFCIKFALNLDDGLHSIKVNVFDASANPSVTEEVYVISRKEYAEDDFCFEPTNSPDWWEEGWDEEQFEYYDESFTSYLNEIGYDEFVRLYNEKKKILRIYDNNGAMCLIDDKGLYSVADSRLKFSCEYTDKNGEKTIEDFSEFDEEKGYRSLALNVDSVCGLEIKIFVEDDFGAKGAFEKVFPEKLYLYEGTSGNDDYISARLSEGQSNGRIVAAEKNKDDIYQDSLYMGSSYYLPKDFDKASFYYAAYSGESSGLYSDLINISIPEGHVEVTGPVKSRDENNHIVMTFNFADDTWDKFDKIECAITRYDYGTNVGSNGYTYRNHDVDTLYIEKGQMSFSYSRNSLYYLDYTGVYQLFYLDNECQFMFTGLSDSFKPKTGEDSESSVIFKTFNINEISDDDTPPYVYLSAEDPEKFTFVARDVGNGSGPVKNNETSANGGKAVTSISFPSELYPYNFSNERNVTLDPGEEWERTVKEIYMAKNFRELLKCINFESETPYIVFNYTVEDAAGNKVENHPCQIPIKIYKEGKISIIKNNNILKYDIPYNGYGPGLLKLFKCENNSWIDVPVTTSNDGVRALKIEPENGEPAQDVFGDSFVKVLTTSQNSYTNDFWYGVPLYKYYGKNYTKNSGKYDYMVPYSDYAPTTTTSPDGAYMVCSDAPVLVHGLYTSSVPYEVCKNWTADEWCFFGNEISCQVLTFSTEKVVTVTLPKDNPEDPEEEEKTVTVTVPVEPVPQICKVRNDMPNSTYVVIAHFADGKVVMSPVVNNQ